MRTLKMNLGKDVNLISLQDAPQGNLDILLFVRGVSSKLSNFKLAPKMMSSVELNFLGDGFKHYAHCTSEGWFGYIEQCTSL